MLPARFLRLCVCGEFHRDFRFESSLEAFESFGFHQPAHHVYGGELQWDIGRWVTGLCEWVRGHGWVKGEKPVGLLIEGVSPKSGVGRQHGTQIPVKSRILGRT